MVLSNSGNIPRLALLPNRALYRSMRQVGNYLNRVVSDIHDNIPKAQKDILRS